MGIKVTDVDATTMAIELSPKANFGPTKALCDHDFGRLQTGCHWKRDSGIRQTHCSVAVPSNARLDLVVVPGPVCMSRPNLKTPDVAVANHHLPKEGISYRMQSAGTQELHGRSMGGYVGSLDSEAAQPLKPHGYQRLWAQYQV